MKFCILLDFCEERVDINMYDIICLQHPFFKLFQYCFLMQCVDKTKFWNYRFYYKRNRHHIIVIQIFRCNLIYLLTTKKMSHSWHVYVNLNTLYFFNVYCIKSAGIINFWKLNILHTSSGILISKCLIFIQFMTSYSWYLNDC